MATALILAGGGLMAASAIQQGRLAEAQGKADKKIALANAETARREGNARLEAATYEESKISRQQKIVQAEQRANFANSGVALNEGSPLDVLADTAYQFNMDRALTLRQGIVGKTSAYNQANIMTAQGNWAAKMGKATKNLSYWKAGGSMAMSAGMAGMKFGGGTSNGINPASQASNPSAHVGYHQV